MSGSAEYAKNRADPSAKRKLAPPACKLQRCQRSHGLLVLPGPNVPFRMTQPSFGLPATQSCAVSAVKTSPDLSVDVGCDDGMGGTATLTMTIQATKMPHYTLVVARQP